MTDIILKLKETEFRFYTNFDPLTMPSIREKEPFARNNTFGKRHNRSEEQ